MMENVLLRFAKGIAGHRVPVLLLLAALLAAAGYGASMSQVDNSLEVWQSADSREYLAYKAFLERTGITDPLIVFVPQQIDAMTLLEIMEEIDSLADVSSCESVSVTTLQGRRATLLSLLPVSDATAVQLAGVLEEVPGLLNRHGLESFALGGVWYLTKELDLLSARATTVLFPVVLLVVGCIVLLLCRSQALLILACGLISAVLLVGLMGLSAVKMNMVLLALPPLTLILGMAHAIHFSIKKWQAGEDVFAVFCRVAPPCMLSGVTTAMGFASLLLSSYGPVRELGLWGAVGTLLSLGVTFSLVPLFLKAPSFSRYLQLPAGTSRFLAASKGKILFLLLLSLIGSWMGIQQLEKGSLILDFFTEDSEVRMNYQAIEDAGIGLTPIEIDLFQQPVSRAELDSSLAELSRLHPEITHYFFTTVDQARQVSSLGAKIHVPDFSDGGQKVERVTILIRTVSSEATLAIADEMETFFQDHLGHSEIPYVTGSVPLYTRGQKQLFSSMLQSFGTAFFAISLLIGLLLRSVKLGFVAMVPNLLPVVLVLAVMGWFSIPLSVATITVASIVFGVVVDDTIHFLYGYQRQDSGLPPVERLEKVFDQVGAPIITTTLVTGTGFLAFLVSPFIPLAYFGLLISLALWMALICDLTVLPVLLLWRKDVS